MTEQIVEEILTTNTVTSDKMPIIYKAATEHIIVEATAINSDIVDDASLRFILVPLAVLFSVFLLSALVLMMARNRRRIMQMYRNRQHVSNFNYLDDDSDTTPLIAGDDIDDPTECLLKGKLQINIGGSKHNTNRYDTTTHSSSQFFT